VAAPPYEAAPAAPLPAWPARPDAHAWPDLPELEEPAPDPEALLAGLERRRRLDREQQGMRWSE
jgi:hypothetical protein